MEKRFKILVVCVCVVLLAGVSVLTVEDAYGGNVLKFQQLPLDGGSNVDGTDYPYYGHDELSTAYSWYYGNAGTAPQFIGYRGCYMADDFGDNRDTPVINLRWWGSYLDNQRYQPVNKFLIVFESDIPAVGDPTDADYMPSHPGAVISSEIVEIGPDTSFPLAAGQYTEVMVSDGGSPCYEHLYEYKAVLKKPFPQKPDTVYWLKIVALVDLDPGFAMAFDQCLIDATGMQTSLCDYLNADPFVMGGCPEVTRWGWHNRDYRVRNPEAAFNVSPGERNQKFLHDADGFATDVWHFQDDCVSGPVTIKQFFDPADPNSMYLNVKQPAYHAEDYVFNSKCFDPLIPDVGVDGPYGIQRFSKDLAFELYTEDGTIIDCNGNGIDDAIDIAMGTSLDCNGNGIPDECEPDCNGNGVPDDCDIAAGGVSKDCNGNGIPDECEPDCNNNGIPDDCDIANGTSGDCNGNGIPDECEEGCSGNGCDVLKFQQLPMDGTIIDGTDYPYYGHDQLSTAYSWFNFAPGAPPLSVGYKGCYMADDFADNKDTPVFCVRWWGSYLGNERIQPVEKFLIVFESDIAAVGDPGATGYVPSHPGTVLSSEIVTLTQDTTLPLAAGQYSEQIISDGGGPCNEFLYEYNTVLKKPFPQKSNTVYWVKIVALVDLEPDYSLAFEQCLVDGAGNAMDLCDYLNKDLSDTGNCPPVTRWGWHNRDYRVKNPEAALNVWPGERNQRNLFGIPGFVTDVWHFQDDCVSGHVQIHEYLNPNDPGDDLLLEVIQPDYKPEYYVFDSKCTIQPATMGVDGPFDIQRFSKDLAFELYTSGGGTLHDCNGNGVDDATDISSGFSQDCNGNGIPDECERDCNDNGVPDDCDIAAGISADCNNNGIPDECENDCNCNGIDDAVEIATGVSQDCNSNGIPDECETDCNGNGVPDDCDIASGFSKDCNSNGIPDECEKDCNKNGIPDDCDIASGFSKDKNQNGVPDECEPPCKKPSYWRCISGKKDDFDTSDGSEPTSPSNYLINNPGYCYYGGLTEFDELPTNTCFIHTINNCCWPASQKVVAATMEIRLKAGPFIPQTDSIIFKQNGTVLWSIKLNDLISWQTSGADWYWSGQSETFVLNLAALPTASTATVDILSSMSNGFLDVIVADDTGVDYIDLRVTTCPCKYQSKLQYNAGINDSFVLPTEPTTPGPELSLIGPAGKDFDAKKNDRPVKHTFANLPPNILSGTLQISLRAGKSGATCNDTINLQANNVGAPGFAWGRRIGTNGPYSWCVGPAGLIGTPWTFGSNTILTLNLSALPNADSTTTCLIARMNADDRLDVYVQDDTIVDYMVLRINTCCRKVVKKLIADINDDLTVDVLDLSIVGRQWLESAIAPLHVEPVDGACPSCP